MEDKLRHWGGGLRAAWHWVFQPLLLGLLLITVILLQPILHLVQSWLVAIGDQQVYQQMAESPAYKARVDQSVRGLVAMIPVERMARIGQDDADSDTSAAAPLPVPGSGDVDPAMTDSVEAGELAMTERERALLVSLEACRDQIADSLSAQMQSLAADAMEDVPAYITQPTPPKVELSIDMGQVKDVITECGADASRVSLEFLATRFGNLTAEALSQQLSDSEVQQALSDSETAGPALHALADRLDADREAWMAHANRVTTAVKGAETVARWRGLTEQGDDPQAEEKTWDYGLILEDLMGLADGSDTDVVIPGLDLDALTGAGSDSDAEIGSLPPEALDEDGDGTGSTARDTLRNIRDLLGSGDDSPAADPLADDAAQDAPYEVLEKSLVELEAIHQRFTDRIRALPPADVAAADDPAAYIREQLGQQVADESLLLVETYSKPYLASIVDLTTDDTVRLTELELTVIAALEPLREGYQGFAYLCHVLQRSVWLILMLICIIAWQLRKIVGWLLAVCLGCSFLTALYSAVATKILELAFGRFYPQALQWSFSRRMMDLAADRAAQWSWYWLYATGGVIVFGMIILLIRRRLDDWSLDRPVRPYLEHLVAAEHRSTLADPILIPLAFYESRVTRADGAPATPDQATLRRRLMGGLGVDYLTTGMLIYAVALFIELLTGGLITSVPFADRVVDPYLVGNVSNHIVGAVLFTGWIAIWATRDALVIAFPRACRWLDFFHWCGLRQTNPEARGGFDRWWRLQLPYPVHLLLVWGATVLVIIFALAGHAPRLNILVVLGACWLIESARLTVAGRLAPIGQFLAHSHFVLIEAPMDQGQTPATKPQPPSEPPADAVATT